MDCEGRGGNWLQKTKDSVAGWSNHSCSESNASVAMSVMRCVCLHGRSDLPHTTVVDHLRYKARHSHRAKDRAIHFSVQMNAQGLA